MFGVYCSAGLKKMADCGMDLLVNGILLRVSEAGKSV
jgi:hypothetical protein